MKSSDLMLGDIVTFRDCLEDGEVIAPIKIIGLGYQARGLEEEALVEINGDETCDVIEINDEIVGIPLTPEILEKNGFKKGIGFGYSETYPTYCWGYHNDVRDFASVEVTFYDEPICGVKMLVRMETNSSHQDGINSIHSCDIESVHELKHALRLCGIEKTIEL